MCVDVSFYLGYIGMTFLARVVSSFSGFGPLMRTTDSDEFLSQINALSVSGAGNSLEPRQSLSALLVTFPWRRGGALLVVVGVKWRRGWRMGGLL